MRAQTKHITTLGFVASHKRPIKSGAQYNVYFDVAEVKGKEIELMPHGSVYDTLKLMEKLVRDTLPQTKKIAQKLKGSSQEQTCNNVWEFLYNHVQYKKDHPMREQLRTPLRSWKDRARGIDCDCYSIFISSILTNLDITHAFRMAGYKGGDFQHVYVVAKVNGKTIIVDPVLDKFNEEAPNTKKYDHDMKVTMLNGVNGNTCPPKPIVSRLRRYAYISEVKAKGYIPTEQFLKENHIPFTQVIDEDTEGGLFQITTANGIENIKPILTVAEAADVLVMFNKPLNTLPKEPHPINDEQPVVEVIDVEKKKFPWLYAAVVALGAILIVSSSDNDIRVKNGLTGPPKRKKIRTVYA